MTRVPDSQSCCLSCLDVFILDGSCRLADFGLSRKIMPGETVQEICGTPEYTGKQTKIRSHNNWTPPPRPTPSYNDNKGGTPTFVVFNSRLRLDLR